MVSSFATKLADTSASEIGKGYGKTTISIVNLRRVEPGTEGAVSLEGTAASIVGGVLLASFAKLYGLLNTWSHVGIVGAAAFAATMFESWLGATWQGGWLTNEVVNFINTAVGAALAVAGVLRFK